MRDLWKGVVDDEIKKELLPIKKLAALEIRPEFIRIVRNIPRLGGSSVREQNFFPTQKTVYGDERYSFGSLEYAILVPERPHGKI